MPSLVKLYLGCTKKSYGRRIVGEWCGWPRSKEIGGISLTPIMCWRLLSHLRVPPTPIWAVKQVCLGKSCPGFGTYLATSLMWKRKRISLMVYSKGAFSTVILESVFLLFPLGVIQFHFSMVCHPWPCICQIPMSVLAFILLQHLYWASALLASVNIS